MQKIVMSMTSWGNQNKFIVYNTIILYYNTIVYNTILEHCDWIPCRIWGSWHVCPSQISAQAMHWVICASLSCLCTQGRQDKQPSRMKRTPALPSTVGQRVTILLDKWTPEKMSGAVTTSCCLLQVFLFLGLHFPDLLEVRILQLSSSQWECEWR